MNARISRSLPFVLSLGLLLFCLSTGLSAQTPIENAASRLVDIFVRIAPLMATIAFIGGGILVAIGHHDAYSRLFNVCIGVAVAMGAITLVNYFR